MTLTKAKMALDKVIVKSRIHLYKPIQIAEILYHKRMDVSMDLLDLESYRSKSKQWRNAVSSELLGCVCTSSARFQDNVFDENATSPSVLGILGKENCRTKGAVEAYIYRRFADKHVMMQTVMDYCLTESPLNFSVETLIALFRSNPGLKRSLDKIYEIVVYSLFITIIDALELKVSLAINPAKLEILKEFEDFTKSIMQLDLKTPIYNQSAKVFRVGVTNAADRGLDMYSNWGPAIQIKHLTLDSELAESIVDRVSSDRIIIVCKDVERPVLVSILNQIGWKARIQSVVTEENLVSWYEKACRGKYSATMGKCLLGTLVEEMEKEFPSIGGVSPIIDSRCYDKLTIPVMWA